MIFLERYVAGCRGQGCLKEISYMMSKNWRTVDERHSLSELWNVVGTNC